MKPPCDAQVAWQICNLILELDVLLWQLYWDEFEKIYEQEEEQKYPRSLTDTHEPALYS